jgi:hypothetical protein
MGRNNTTDWPLRTNEYSSVHIDTYSTWLGFKCLLSSLYLHPLLKPRWLASSRIPPTFMVRSEVHLARLLQVRRHIPPVLKLPPRPAIPKIRKAIPLTRRVGVFKILPPRFPSRNCAVSRTSRPQTMNPSTLNPAVVPRRTVLAHDTLRPETGGVFVKVLSRSIRRHDRGDSLCGDLAQHFRDIGDLVFERVGNRARVSGCGGSASKEEVGEARGGDTEIGFGISDGSIGLPCLVQIHTSGNDGERRRERNVGAGGADDGVDLPLYSVDSHNPLGGKAFDRRADVGDIFFGESFEISGPGSQPSAGWCEFWENSLHQFRFVF